MSIEFQLNKMLTQLEKQFPIRRVDIVIKKFPLKKKLKLLLRDTEGKGKQLVFKCCFYIITCALTWHLKNHEVMQC